MQKINALVCLAVLFVLSGCTGTAQQAAAPNLPDALPASRPFARELTVPPAAPADAPEAAPVVAAFKGSGEVAYTDSAAERLNTNQEALLCAYMNTWYTSLALLQVQDASRLFSEEARNQEENDRLVLEALIGIREMQKTDLSLSGYSFRLDVQSIQPEEGTNDMRIRVREYSIQNFAAYPGVDSESFNITHNFLLTLTDGGWRIREHRQSGSINRVLMGGWRTAEATEVQANVKSLLANARLHVARRNGQGTEAAVLFDHGYDREAAAAYARRWADENNGNWPVYDRMGGNCQNFTSQAIHAGGVPMDYTAPAQWKWYGDTPNASFTPTGRSPAWSGVSEFLSYVRDNRGYGMVAVADAPYYTGEPGDVIHLSRDGEDWSHTVMITRVLTDARGNTVDYLVASNTADLRDFPVSAYYYTHQMLIKIYGWNA